MIPQMKMRGYGADYAVNVTSMAALIALLLPPSHNMIIYSISAGGKISIADLFTAGIIPGLLIGLSLMILVLFIARRDNFPKGEPITLREAGRIAVESLWGLLTVFIILGGIVGGIFTPTEAAAVGAFAAFVMLLCARQARGELGGKLVESLRNAVTTTVMILFTIASAWHMKIGMQVIIEDYVHDERLKLVLIIGNNFFSIVVALAAIYAVLKLSSGV